MWASSVGVGVGVKSTGSRICACRVWVSNGTGGRGFSGFTHHQNFEESPQNKRGDAAHEKQQNRALQQGFGPLGRAGARTDMYVHVFACARAVVRAVSWA